MLRILILMLVIISAASGFGFPFSHKSKIVGRTNSGDPIIKDSDHKDVHVFNNSEAREYQRFLTHCRHISHCSSANSIEEATAAELKIYLEWKHKTPTVRDFPNRY